MGNHGGKTAPPPPKQLPPSQQTTDQKLSPNNPPVKGSKRNRSKSRSKEKSAEARQPKSAEMRGGLSTEKAKIKNVSPLKSSEKKTKESNKSKEKAPRRKITGDAKANSKEKTLSKETAVVSEYVSIVIPAPHRRKITGDSKEGKKTKGNSVYCDVPLAAPTRRKITGDPKMNELPPKKEKRSKSKEKSFEQTGDINTNNNAQKQKILKTSPQKVQSLTDGPSPRPLTTQSLNTLSTYTEAKATVPPGKAKSVPTTGEKETRTKSIYTVTQNASKERTENSRSAEREQNGKEEGSVRKIKKSKRKKKPSVSTAEQKKREIAKQKEREKRRQLFKGAKKMIEAAKQKRSGESTYSTTIDEPKTTTMADIDDEVLAKTQDDESSLYCSTVDASKIDHFVTHTISRGCQSIEKEYNCHKEELKVDEKLCTLFYSNPTKNRTNDIPCIDSTRVILRDDRVKNIDYIHANYVNTVSKKKRFICTQTPKENTSVDFWLMILQHKTSLILMLGDYPTTGQKVCYFPQEIGELSFHRADESNVIEVQCEKITEIGGDKGIRKRSLCVRRGKDEMRVDHLHCKKWKENGPTDGTVQIILEEFSSYLSPIIVHCTNGTSKTGSLIALSLVVDSFDNGNTMETIENIVKTLRQQRAVTVSTVQQYLWIYRILVDIFHRFGPLSEVEEFRKQIDSRIANNK